MLLKIIIGNEERICILVARPPSLPHQTRRSVEEYWRFKSFCPPHYTFPEHYLSGSNYVYTPKWSKFNFKRPAIDCQTSYNTTAAAPQALDLQRVERGRDLICNCGEEWRGLMQMDSNEGLGKIIITRVFHSGRLRFSPLWELFHLLKFRNARQIFTYLIFSFVPIKGKVKLIWYTNPF